MPTCASTTFGCRLRAAGGAGGESDAASHPGNDY